MQRSIVHRTATIATTKRVIGRDRVPFANSVRFLKRNGGSVIGRTIYNVYVYMVFRKVFAVLSSEKLKSRVFLWRSKRIYRSKYIINKGCENCETQRFDNYNLFIIIIIFFICHNCNAPLINIKICLSNASLLNIKNYSFLAWLSRFRTKWRSIGEKSGKSGE